MELPLWFVAITSIVFMTLAYIQILKKDNVLLSQIVEEQEAEVERLEAKIERLETLSGIEVIPLPVKD